jgi:hypothetical protein
MVVGANMARAPIPYGHLPFFYSDIFEMRGVAEHGSRTVTTLGRGLYEEDAELRREFPAEVRR